MLLSVWHFQTESKNLCEHYFLSLHIESGMPVGFVGS